MTSPRSGSCGGSGLRNAMRRFPAAMQRDLPDTPPVDVSFVAGLLAHGSKRLPSLPGASCSSDLKSDSCSPLTVAGAAPALPRHDGEAHRIPVLAADPHESTEPRTLDMVRESIMTSTSCCGGAAKAATNRRAVYDVDNEALTEKRCGEPIIKSRQKPAPQTTFIFLSEATAVH